MKIQKEKVISLSYELHTGSKDGTMIEKVTGDDPLSFIYGMGSMLPKFEENLSGMALGDEFEFDLIATDAYGDINPQAIVEIPKQSFELDGRIDDEMLQPGSLIPMMDRAGNRLTGKVLSVSSDMVKMDFNHPLAGEHLFFKGSIVGVREATHEEIKHGLDHKCDSCGCGSDCCS